MDDLCEYCGSPMIYADEPCGCDSSTMARKDALLREAVLAMQAVRAETYGGLYCCDVNGVNWFDFTKNLITEIKKETDQ